MIADSAPPYLVVVWTSGKNYQSRYVKVDGDVEAELQAIANESLGLIDQASGKEYDPDSEQGVEPCLAVPNEEVFDEQLIAAIRPGESLDLITSQELSKKTLFCYAVVVDEGDSETAILIRKASPIRLAKKTLVAQFFEDKLDRIESPIFAFDSEFDVVVRGSKVFALSQTGFESLFKSSTVVQAKLGQWVTDLFQRLPILDASKEEFVERASTNSFTRRKIQAVLRKSHISRLTVDAFELLAREQVGEAHGLMVDGYINLTKDTEKEILNILNEDNHRGPISGQRYISLRKEDRKSSKPVNAMDNEDPSHVTEVLTLSEDAVEQLRSRGASQIQGSSD